MRLHGWAVVCDEASVKVEYLNRDNGTRVVFHRNDPYANAANENAQKHLNVLKRIQKYSNELSMAEQAAYDFLARSGGAKAADVAKAINMFRKSAQKLLAHMVEKASLLLPAQRETVATN